MKTTPETQVEAYHASGAWTDDTIYSLFAAAAQAHPDRLAVVDAPDRANWTGGQPRQLTYAEAADEIDRLASFYGALGLSTDHVLGIQAPNTVDAVIAFLAALRANLIVAPLPLHWRQKNVLDALNAIGAKGLIAADRVETRQVAKSARDVAAELFSLRFVFGLGKDIPDGLIKLGPMLAEMGDDLPPLELERDASADHVATICWSRSGSETAPVARSHGHWTAAARHLLSEADPGSGHRFLVPYALSGLTGIGAGLMPWLMTGGTLHLHHPTSLNLLTAHANDVEADYVLTPGPLAQILDRNITRPQTVIAAAWNVAAPEPGAFSPRHPVVDLHVADEFALIAKARGSSAKVQATALGKHGGRMGCESGPALVEIGLHQKDGSPAAPSLKVKGPMVPDFGWTTRTSAVFLPDEDGFIDTRIHVRPVDGGIAGFGIPGQYAVGTGDLGSIDCIYAAYPGVRDAAAFLVEDSVLGARLHAALVPVQGTVPDAKAFYAFLDAEGVDLAKIPHRVLVLQSLPTHEDGSLNRERLTLRTQRLPAAVA